jgi:hypothetical protein
MRRCIERRLLEDINDRLIINKRLQEGILSTLGSGLRSAGSSIVGAGRRFGETAGNAYRSAYVGTSNIVNHPLTQSVLGGAYRGVTGVGDPGVGAAVGAVTGAAKYGASKVGQRLMNKSLTTRNPTQWKLGVKLRNVIPNRVQTVGHLANAII